MRRWKKLRKMLEDKARYQRLRENPPSAKDFYRLLRDTNFAGACSELCYMMSHPYFASVPLGKSRYGEYNIQVSTNQLLLRIPRRRSGEPFCRCGHKITSGQMSQLKGIDSG